MRHPPTPGAGVNHAAGRGGAQAAHRRGAGLAAEGAAGNAAAGPAAAGEAVEATHRLAGAEGGVRRLGGFRPKSRWVRRQSPLQLGRHGGAPATRKLLEMWGEPEKFPPVTNPGSLWGSHPSV